MNLIQFIALCCQSFNHNTYNWPVKHNYVYFTATWICIACLAAKQTLIFAELMQIPLIFYNVVTAVWSPYMAWDFNTMNKTFDIFTWVIHV